MWYYILSCFFYLFIVNNRKNRNVINSTLYLEKNQYNQNDTSYEKSAIINLQILNRELQKILDN